MSDNSDRTGVGSLLAALAEHPEALRLLRAIAVLRRPVDILGLVALVGDWEQGDDDEALLTAPPRFEEDLERLQSLGLVVPFQMVVPETEDEDEEPELLWNVPDWVRRDLPPAGEDIDVRMLHQRAAHFWGWRATALTGDVDDLMEARHHHLEAGEQDAAVDLTCVLAEALVASGEADRAEELLREALAWSSDRSANAARLWRDMGAAYLVRGQRDEAESHYRRSLDRASDLGDIEMVNDAVFALATIAQEMGRLDEAQSLFERALPVFEAAGRDDAVAACRHNLGALAARRGDHDRAERELSAAAAAAPDDEERARSFQELGMVAQWRGDYDHAETVLADALALAEAAHSEDVILSTRVRLGSLAVERGDVAHAREHADTALALANALADERAQAYANVLVASVAWIRGDLAETADAACRALAHAEAAGDRSVRTSACDYLGLVALERGDFPDAIERFESALADAEAVGAQSAIATERAHIATTLRERDGAASGEADEWLLRARDIFREIGHLGALAWCDAEEAEARRKSGKLEDAARALDRAEQAFHRMGNALGEVRARLERGRLAEAGGDGETAVNLLRAGLEAADRLGDRAGAAHAASRLGVLLTDRDGPEAGLPWTLRALAFRLAQRSRHAAEDLAQLAAQRDALGPARFDDLLVAQHDPAATDAARNALASRD